MNLTELLDSKVFVREGSGVKFPSPTELVEPFLEAIKEEHGDDVSEASLRVEGANPVVNAEAGDDGVMNIAYPRVVCEWNMGDDVVVEGVEKFSKVLGFVYALDTQKPNVKVYHGYNASACINLCIFNAENVFAQELMGNYPEVYEKAKVYIANQIEEHKKFKATIERLATEEMNRWQVDNVIGMSLRRSYKNSIFGSDHVVKASKMLEDGNGVYGMKNGKTTKWNMYNAFTQTVTDSKNIAARPDKTLAIAKLLEVENAIVKEN